MKSTVLHIAFLLSFFQGISQGIKILDQGMKKCLVDSLPALVNLGDSTLIQAEAQGFTGTINCPGQTIQSLAILSEFTNAGAFYSDSISKEVDLTPLTSMTKLRNLVIRNSEIALLPDLSGMSELNYLELEHSNLEEFPSLPSGISIVSLEFSPLTSVSLDQPFPNMRQLMLNENALTSVTGLSNAPTLEILFLGGNQLTELNELEFLDSLQRLQLWGSQLSALPGMQNKPNLIVVNIGYNQFEEVPDFGNTPPERLSIAGNALTFEDIVPLFEWPNIPENYENQGKQGASDTLTVTQGTTWQWTLDFDQDETQNTYTWYKDGQVIETSAEGSLILSNFSADDAGVYSCEVRNAVATDLTLEVMPRTLEFEAFGAHEEPIIFTPDGDGNNDELFIQYAGTAKIYDESGGLVKELSVPGNWDGTTDSGETAELGYYFIIVEGEGQFPVTLLR